MHADRPSITAALIAAVRALYTALPEPYRIAPDPFAERLIPAPLALPAKLAARAPWAAPLIHRGLGALSLGVTHHAALRTRAIDDAVRDAVREGARQVVILGAGLDSRALRMPELHAMMVFEVDYSSTQRYKIDRLERARGSRVGGEGVGRPATEELREVRRVAIDFEKERLADVLLTQGFRIDEPSFWIWEGVTVYLTLEAIDGTLKAIASLSSPGSRLAVTYTPPTSGIVARLGPIIHEAFRGFGEPLRTMLLPGEMADALERAGFSLLTDDSTADWAERYWPLQHARRVRVVEHLAIAERRASAETGGELK